MRAGSPSIIPSNRSVVPAPIRSTSIRRQRSLDGGQDLARLQVDMFAQKTRVASCRRCQLRTGLGLTCRIRVDCLAGGGCEPAFNRMVLLQALSYRASGMRFQSGKQLRLLLAVVAAIREHDEVWKSSASPRAGRRPLIA
jgi:hypothetical protein